MRLTTLTTTACLIVAGCTLSAQEVAGSVSGTVKSADGKPIAGALVRLTSAKSLTTKTATTDANGAFRMPFILPETYTATATKDGYIGSKLEFRVGAGAPARADFTLRNVQTESAVVEVVAVSATVDKTSTKTATSATIDDIEKIPTAGNYAIKALAALQLAPSVNQSNPYYATVRGGAQGQTQYLVNGLSVRDNITSQGRPHDVILDDLVEESQVILSPLNAKYGDSSAGLVNIVEKTGGNEWSGAVRVKMDKPTWSALRPIGRGRFNQTVSTAEPSPSSDDLSRIYELSFSGPIIKDRLTLTYGTRLQPDANVTRFAGDLTINNSVFGPGGTIQPGQRYDGYVASLSGPAQRNIAEKFRFHQGRLFLRINDNHSLDYSHAENFNQYADWGGGANTASVDLSLPPNQTSTTMFRQLTYRGTFGSNQALEVRYGAREGSIQFVSGPGDPITLRWGPSAMSNLKGMTSAFVVNGGNADSQPEMRNTYSFVANYQAYFDLFGKHSLDAGINHIKTKWGTVQNSGGPRGYTFRLPGQINTGNRDTGFMVFNYNDAINGYNYFTASADRYIIPQMVWYTGVPAAELTKPVMAYYVNDQWTLNDNFSLMMGVRMEQYKYEDGKGEKYNSSTVSPRLEAKWDLNGDNTRLVNFTYAQFRGNVHERITRAFSSFRRTTVVTKYWNQGAGQGLYTVDKAAVLNPANYGYTYDFQVPDAVFAIDKSFKPDVSNEMTVGYERMYDGGGKLKIVLVNRTWDDLPMSFGGTNVINIADPTGSGLPSKTNYLRTLKNDPDSKRTYKAIEVEFAAWLLKDQLRLAGTYSYGRTTGNSQMQDGTGFNSGFIEGGWFRDQYLAMGIPRDAFDPEGQLNTSQNNSLTVMLNYYAKAGAARSVISLMGRYNDGAVETRTTNTMALPTALNPAIAQLPSAYTHFWNGRGQYTQPDNTSWDLAYNLDLPVYKKVRFSATLTVQNIFNVIRKTGTYWGNDTATYTATNRPGYVGNVFSGNSQYYGAYPSYTWFQGGRNFGLDFGIKF